MSEPKEFYRCISCAVAGVELGECHAPRRLGIDAPMHTEMTPAQVRKLVSHLNAWLALQPAPKRRAKRAK